MFNSQYLFLTYTFFTVSLTPLASLSALLCLLLFWILLSGNVHPNPAPSQLCISLAHLNARSLCSSDKLHEISALTILHKFDFLAITETWISVNITDYSVLIPGYSAPLRNDRIAGRGGGVAIYLADHLFYKRRTDFENDNLELLWVKVMKNSKPLCGVCYRPPNTSSEGVGAFFDSLQNNLTPYRINANGFSSVVLLGDFNAHYNFVDTPSTSTDTGLKLYSFLECNNLFQLIEGPTRITRSTESILDLIISDFLRLL